MEDVTSLNPLEITESMSGEGRMGSNCTMQEKVVGKLGPGQNLKAERRCSPPIPSKCMIEGFNDYDNYDDYEKDYYLPQNRGKRFQILAWFIMVIIMIIATVSMFSHLK